MLSCYHGDDGFSLVHICDFYRYVFSEKCLTTFEIATFFYSSCIFLAYFYHNVVCCFVALKSYLGLSEDRVDFLTSSLVNSHIAINGGT